MDKNDYEELKQVYYRQMACEESMCESEYERGKTEGMREMMCKVKRMSDGNKEETSESGLNKHFVSNNEVAVCDSSCPYWGYQCNINEMFKECAKHRK